MDPEIEVPHEEKHRSGLTDELVSFVWETVKIIVISLVIILPVRYYLVQPFFVKGQSMVPNYQDKDYILVDKLSYQLDKAERGDVVVFKFPLDPTDYFIKRIIGLPGESLAISNNRVIIYNARYPDGFTLDETAYLPDYPKRMDNLPRLQIPEGEFFVMGDNRPASSDSRTWGTLAQPFISGKAWVRLWPLEDLLKIPSVAYPTPNPI